MKENLLNNDYVKALSLTGAISSVIFSIYRKSGLLKGVGNYFLFTITGALAGAAIYKITKK